MRVSVEQEQEPERTTRARVVAGAVASAAAVATAATLLFTALSDDESRTPDVEAMCVEAERAWQDVKALSVSGAPARWFEADESLDRLHDAAMRTEEPVLRDAAGAFRAHVLALEDPDLSEVERRDEWRAALEAFDDIDDRCAFAAS